VAPVVGPASARPATNASARSHSTVLTSEETEQTTIMTRLLDFPDQPDFDDFPVFAEIVTVMMVPAS
jgi:hypothetical protein